MQISFNVYIIMSKLIENVQFLNQDIANLMK